MLEDYKWYVNLVKDRYAYYDLTFPQAEQVYRYEQERDKTYTEKYIFSAWEEFEYELFVFRHILNAGQLKKYEEDYRTKIKASEESVTKMDAERQNAVEHARERLDYYRNVFIPEFKSTISAGPATLMTLELNKVDFFKKEYGHFLGVEKRGILVQHFREHRLFAPNLLQSELLRHDVNYLLPDYYSFKKQFDEPLKVVDAHLRAKIYVLDELEQALGQRFEMLKAFNKANFDKHYPDFGGWRMPLPKTNPEEEKKDRVMTLLLFDYAAYGWFGPNPF